MTTATSVPRIRGFGKGVTGGAGGTRVYVTNYNLTGEGSLKAAIDEDLNGEKKIIDFSQLTTPGYLDVTDNLRIGKTCSNTTIDGWTAKVEFVIRKASTYASSLFEIDMRNSVGTPDNLIIRGLRFAHGAENASALNSSMCLEIKGGTNIWVHHCSFRWSEDNLIGIHRGPQTWTVHADSNPDIYNIAVTNCLFAESFGSHATGINITENMDDLATSPKTRSRFGSLYNVTIANNMFIGCGWRVPQAVAKDVEILNNIVHNHGQYVCHTKDDAKFDFVGNYARSGPRKGLNVSDNRLEYTDLNGYVEEGFTPSIHIAENYYDQGTQIFDGRGIDNWSTMVNNPTAEVPGATVPTAYQRESRLSHSLVSDASIIDPVYLAIALPDNVGAQVPTRDDVDNRLIEEYNARTGHSSQPTALADVPEGGWPTL